MFIKDPEIPGIKVFKTKNRVVINYLIYDNHLSIFSLIDGVYGFQYNDNLKTIIKNFPISIKILVNFEGLNKNLK